MTGVERSFDELIEEADRRPLAGWDLSLDGRIEASFPWDFAAIVSRHARAASRMLDMGTGGGEWLSTLAHRPAETIATEAWPPNFAVAADRLKPLAIDVVAVTAAPDNTDQAAPSVLGTLPFRDGAFDLVINRHESYVPSEVRRVLAPGGVFLTQQVASRYADGLYALFDIPLPERLPAWDLAFAARQLGGARLLIEEQGEDDETMRFADVGALAWYAKNMPGLFADFSIGDERPRLAHLHERLGGEALIVRQPLFWIKARRAPA